MDPPRVDTAVTIEKIKFASVDVKMITGDHLNIAKELARQARDLPISPAAASRRLPPPPAASRLLLPSLTFSSTCTPARSTSASTSTPTPPCGLPPRRAMTSLRQLTASRRCVAQVGDIAIAIAIATPPSHPSALHHLSPTSPPLHLAPLHLAPLHPPSR